jgi:hypothetical protein
VRRYTPTAALANYLLPDGLDQFVRERRDAGKSWRRIALELRDATGVDVTHQTLYAWFAGDENGEAA